MSTGMNALQRMLVFVGFGLVTLNALFPPRMDKHSHDRPLPRAFVLSSGFYDAEIVKKDRQIDSVTITRASYSAVLNSERFWVVTVAITAATISLMALAGFTRKRAEGRGVEGASAPRS